MELFRLKRARCPDCGKIEVYFDREENMFLCSCGSSFDHHPGLCPTFHMGYGCIYSRGGRPSSQGMKGFGDAFPSPFKDPYNSPFPENRKRR
jgi:hypothetical protein